LLTESASDSVTVPNESLPQKLGLGRKALNVELEQARKALADRLAERTFETTNELIRLHSLEGQTAQKMTDLAQENFGAPQQINESVWSLIGGVATGATGGLLADILSGGLTFGGGVLAGAIGGGASAYVLAKGYNLARGSKNSVRWSQEHFVEQLRLALLTYLAVAHFGRGRGTWEESEHPAFWRAEVAKAVDAERSEIESDWKRSDEAGQMDSVQQNLKDSLRRAASRVLRKIYPSCDL